MGERVEHGSDTSVYRPGAELDLDRLAAWMSTNIEGFEGALEAIRFKDGQSNPTYKLRTPGRTYVLRRKPPGKIFAGAHAIEREYEVCKALHSAGFPVAHPLALCTDESIAGTNFYVMEMVEGRIFWDGRFPEVSTDDRPRYFDAMNDTIAALHRIDFRRIGLGDYGKTGNYFTRQLTRWAGQYREDRSAGSNPHMDALIEWLSDNIPNEDESAIVHGDFRCDNMIFDPVEPRVIAVLDWELSTLGHPLADFTYHLMMYRMPAGLTVGLKDIDLAAFNIPGEHEYVASYCRRTGREGIANLDFHMTFNMFRVAAILHGIKGRMLRGNASSGHAAQMAANFEPMANLAWLQTGLDL